VLRAVPSRIGTKAIDLFGESLDLSATLLAFNNLTVLVASSAGSPRWEPILVVRCALSSTPPVQSDSVRHVWDSAVQPLRPANTGDAEELRE